MDGGEGLPRADVVVADMEDEVESDAGPSPTTDTPPATTVTTTKEQPSQLARRACDVCNKRVYSLLALCLATFVKETRESAAQCPDDLI